MAVTHSHRHQSIFIYFDIILFISFFRCLIALKIHITAEMNDELASIGGFKTEHRGLIDVKVGFKTNNFEEYENERKLKR